MADDHQGAAAASAQAEVAAEEPPASAARARERQRALRLLLVGDADDVRQARALGEGADDLGAGLEALRHPGLVAAHRRRRAHPHGHLGDHAEHPLGADDQLPQRRPGGGVRGFQGPQLAGRGEQADRADQRVEAPVAARGLAGRAGRGEAADRRVLEGLREVAEGEALARPAPPPPRARAGRRRGGRSASGGRRSTSRRAPRSRLISRSWAPRSGSTPPTTLVPPPKGTTAMPSRGADVEHAAQGLGVGGQHDRVGRRLEAAAAHPRQVDVAAPARVAQPVLVRAEDRLGADRLDQRRAAAARAAAARSPRARAPAATAPARRSAPAAPPAPPRPAPARSPGPPSPTSFESRRGRLRIGERLTSAPARSRRAPRRGSRPGRGASSASPAATSLSASAPSRGRPAVPPSPLAQGDLDPRAAQVAGERRALQLLLPDVALVLGRAEAAEVGRAPPCPRASPAPWSTGCAGRRSSARRSRPGSCAATSAAGCRGRRRASRPRRPGPRSCVGG